MKVRLALLVLCVFLTVSNAVARLVSPKDPLDSVLDAQLVVIVRQAPIERSNLFEIEEVFLGDKKRGDYIDVGHIKLEADQLHGPPVIEPISPNTRILLFLKAKKEILTAWEPTYYQEFFWVQKP